MKFSATTLAVLFGLANALPQDSMPPIIGLGSCPKPCHAVTNGASGALLYCCALAKEDFGACHDYSTACKLGEAACCCNPDDCPDKKPPGTGCPEGCVPNGSGCYLDNGKGDTVCPDGTGSYCEENNLGKQCPNKPFLCDKYADSDPGCK